MAIVCASLARQPPARARIESTNEARLCQRPRLVTASFATVAEKRTPTGAREGLGAACQTSRVTFSQRAVLGARTAILGRDPRILRTVGPARRARSCGVRVWNHKEIRKLKKKSPGHATNLAGRSIEPPESRWRMTVRSRWPWAWMLENGVGLCAVLESTECSSCRRGSHPHRRAHGGPRRIRRCARRAYRAVLRWYPPTADFARDVGTTWRVWYKPLLVGFWKYWGPGGEGGKSRPGAARRRR